MYYVRLKNGQLRTQKSTPKNKPFVTEVVQTDPKDQQHTTHEFLAFSAEGRPMAGGMLQAFCGQDRGPRLEAKIQRMFQSPGL